MTQEPRTAYLQLDIAFLELCHKHFLFLGVCHRSTANGAQVVLPVRNLLTVLFFYHLWAIDAGGQSAHLGVRWLPPNHLPFHTHS